MEEQSNRKTYLKVFVNLGIMLAVILFCIFVVPRVIIFFMPFVIGWIISLVASPLVRFF
jgi:flagellar biogenesis protein FliO